MGYSTGIFSEIGPFFQVAVTQKIEVRINSNLLHSINTSICIRKCNIKFVVISEPFLEKNHGL